MRVHLWILPLLYVLSLCAADGEEPAQVKKTAAELRVEGDDFTKERKYSEAAKSFGDAIDLEPSESTNYYRRATVYLIMNKPKGALSDLEKVLEIKPDHQQARQKRAKLYLQRGSFTQAREDYEELLKAKPGTESYITQLNSIVQAETHQKFAEEHFGSGNWEEAINSLGALIDLVPDFTEFRLKRAECNLNLKRYNPIMEDMNKVLKLYSDNVDALYFKGKALYLMGQNDAAMSHFKKALSSDPDNRKCRVEFKKINRLVKLLKNGEQYHNEGKFQESHVEYTEALNSDPDNTFIKPNAYLFLCRNSIKLNKPQEAILECEKSIEADDGNVDPYMNKAEAHITLEQYQEAINAYNKAHEKQPQNHNIQQGLHNARRLLKISQRKDYYKILNVNKGASERDIKKAYRAAAIKWHPDKHDDKDLAKEKYIEIGEAYEVLNNEEKRRRYDNGEDLDQPQQPHFHNPFGGGGNPFGGGNGFNFEFNFG